MSENYGIVLGIDASQAESGGKATTAAINGVVSSLEKLQQRATSAFAALDRASQHSDFSKLSREAAGQVTAAQDMAIAYNSLGAAVRRAQSILGQRISGNAAASLATLGREIARFSGQMNGLATQTKNFGNLRSLGSILGNMKFTGPSPAAVRNFQNFLNVVGTANVSQLRAVSQAMQGFSNLRVRLPAAPRPQAPAAAIGGNIAAGSAGIGRARTALEGLNNTLSMSYQLSTVLRVALGSLTLGHFAKDIFDATANMQQFDRMIEAVATSEQEVSQNKAFIDQLTSDLPVGLGVAQTSFGKFNASIRLSGESAENSRKLFSQLSTAFTVLHLSTQQMNNAFLAVEEMFNKGTITSQQLKRQLSQYLPGAFELVATSIGKTTGQLAAMMEQGQVPAAVMFKLGETLQSIYGPELAAALVTSRNQVTLLSNDVQKFMQSIGRNGFDSGLSAMLQGIRQAMGASDLEEAARRIGQGFQSAFAMIGAAASVLIENWDTVAKVLMGFTGFTVLSLGVMGLSALLSPFIGVIGFLAESLILTGGAGLTAASGIGAAGMAAGSAAPALAAAATSGGAAGAAAAGAGVAAAGSVGLWARLGGALGRVGSTALRLAGTFAKGFAYTELLINLPEIGKLAGDVTGKLMDATGAAEYLAKNHPDFSKWFVQNMPTVDFDHGFSGMFGSLFGGSAASDKAKEEAKKIGSDAKSALAPTGDVPPMIKFLGLDKVYQQYQQSMSKIEGFNADYKAKMDKVDNEIFQANKKREDEINRIRQQGLDNITKKTQQLLQKIDPIAKARTDAAQEQKILDELLQKKLINEEQYQAYKKRLDYENLKATNPAAAVVRGFDEQFAVLKQTGDARDTENKLLSLRNQLLKEGVDIDAKANAGLRENLRSLIDAQRELERGGSNGFARWSSGLKSFRESLIDVEKNGVEKLSDGLADLSVGKGINIQQIGMGVLRDFNKSIINDLMRKAIDPLKGMNSPLASIFGLGAPDPNKALAGAKEAASKVAPITSKGLMDQLSAGTMNVTAGSVSINGGVAGAVGGGVQPNAVNGKVSGYYPDLDPKYSSQAASNGFRIAGNNNILPSGQFAGSVIEPKKTNIDQTAMGTGILSPAQSAFNAPLFVPPVSVGKAAADAAKTAPVISTPTTVPTNVPANIPAAAGAASGGSVIAGDLSSMATYRGRAMDPNAVQGIIFHHTGGRGTPEGVVNTLNQRGLGTQYVMDRNGKVFQTLPDNTTGAQIMPSDRFKGAPRGLSNSNTVGVEMIAKNNKDLTEAQIASAKRFYAEEKLKYPNALPYGHGEVNPGHKEMDEGMGAVNAIRNQQNVAQNPDVTGSIAQTQQATEQLQTATAQASSNISTLSTDISQVGSNAAGAQGGLGGLASGLSKLFQGGMSGNPMGIASGAMSMGGMFGMFKEGGLSTSPVEFFNAPRYAEGTAKAARAAGTASLGGGFPAVLHDNEAVIPLTRGREVPVALTGDGANSNQGPSQNTTNVHLHGVKDFDSFRKSKSQLKAEMATSTHLASQRNN